ncbi:MAG: aminomethyl-transferring glycine dehydrogenase subunit GcvPA [Candidatus Adiutrix sp.]|nr:aminomethyl-transferring glycine dehydrogenase subunit GcvPA [Candidatus Adiutrix sp.]
MRYLPHTPDDIKEMLAVVGAKSLDELFDAIPADSRRQRPLALPAPLTEWELAAKIGEMAARGGGDWQVFVNAGSQPHHIPALTPYLAGRQEFLTSYTPYQPEMSQGTLQAIFEFQTLISRLTGLAVTNASMYDGATAMAEAALMAQRVVKRRAVAVSELVHPHWREVLATYLAPMADVEITTLPAGPDGRTDYGPLKDVKNPAVLLMQSPNFLGVIEDLKQAAEAIHGAGGLLASGFSEAFALGLIKSPGSLGADIVFGEGQSLGLPQGFGGPTLGLMSTKLEHVRQFPGRLVGQTKDLEGKRGFVLTLSTREQHIRRSKAVSNICSNAGHCALTAAIFMACLGGSGFRRMAQVNLDLAEYLKAELVKAGWKPLSSAPTFNEFALIAPGDFQAKHKELSKNKILAGLPLAAWYPKLKNAWLFGVTETRTRADIDAFVREVK